MSLGMSASVPSYREMAGLPDDRGRNPEIGRKSWSVFHACNSARELQATVDAQLSAGIRPYVVTRQGVEETLRTANQSPLGLWQEVRRWRKELDEAVAPLWRIDRGCILHAHSFAAGMAAVRGDHSPVVYDIGDFVESAATASFQSGAWMARSFRTAEQFVCERAAVTVVHTLKMKADCLARGLTGEDVFVVPEPIYLPILQGDSTWLQRQFGFSSVEKTIAIYAQAKTACRGTNLTTPTGDNLVDIEALFAALAQVRDEGLDAKLFLECEGDSGHIRRAASRYQVADDIFVVDKDDAIHVIASADIVIASAWEEAIAPVGVGTSLRAMANGRALLAADSVRNRDLTPDGRGCLWFEGGNARDLAHRLSFLARNADFRGALGASALRFLAETRSPERIGKMYDEVYRHAYHRRARGTDPKDRRPSLITAQVCI